jgi:hypothetical protein
MEHWLSPLVFSLDERRNTRPVKRPGSPRESGEQERPMATAHPKPEAPAPRRDDPQGSDADDQDPDEPEADHEPRKHKKPKPAFQFEDFASI